MSNPPVETVSTGADKAKLAIAGLLVIGAVAAFYALGKQDQWVRVVALLGLLAVAVGIFFTSESGKQLIAYGQDSAKEVRKVVWPTQSGWAPSSRHSRAERPARLRRALRRPRWRNSLGRRDRHRRSFSQGERAGCQRARLTFKTHRVIAL